MFECMPMCACSVCVCVLPMISKDLTMALLRPVHSLVGAEYNVLVHGHDVLCTARDCVCVTRGTRFPLRDSKLCVL